MKILKTSKRRTLPLKTLPRPGMPSANSQNGKDKLVIQIEAPSRQRKGNGHPAHEPAHSEPTPDPSQEGNRAPKAAPLLGRVGGGFGGRNE